VIDFSRSYQFALTDAAVLTAATWALLACDGFSRRGWSLAWGFLIGLTPLARTMAVAFLPAQLIAAAWLIAVRPGARRPRLINLAWSLALSALTAATWLANSLKTVVSYLTNFGYGAQSSHFAESGSRLSIGYWTRELVNSVRQDLYLPLAALLALSLVLAAAAGLARRRTEIRAGLRRWIVSDSAIVGFVLLEEYVAVSSSRNEGVGFRVPLLPAFIVLVVAALITVPWRIPRRVVIGALIAASVFNVVMKADAVRGLSGSSSVTVAGFGRVPVAHGDGYIQGYVLGSEETRAGSATQPLPASQRGWLPAYAQIVREIFDIADERRVTPVVQLATSEPLVNANDLTLAARLDFKRDLTVALLPGPPGPASLASYEQTLRQARPTPNVLVTVSTVGFTSYFALGGLRNADQGLLERAATVAGFPCAAGIPLPDGRTAVISWRTSPTAAGSSAASCAPRVSRMSPVAGSTAVASTASVVAVFTLPIQPSALPGAITLTDTDSGKPEPGTLLPFGETAIVFRPRRPLPGDTRFTATVTTTARADTGDALPAAQHWSFTTGANGG
jgi:hypothetical protein